MRTIKQNTDGSLEIKVIDTRTLEQKLTGMPSFKDRMDAMFPTTEAEITKGWAEYDDHKFYK